MATPSALVFKVPELAQMGYALDKQAQAEREKEEAKREQFSKSLGVQSKMLEGGYKLVGQFQQAAQLSYNAWKEANIEYERTGSSEAKAALEARTQEFNQVFGVGLASSNSMSQQLLDYSTSGGKGYLQNKDEVSAQQSSFLSGSVKTDNGVNMVLEGGQWVPFLESQTFSTQPTSYNTFALEKRNPELTGYTPLDLAANVAKSVYSLDGVQTVYQSGRVSYNLDKAAEKTIAEIASRRENDPSQLRKEAIWWWAKTNNKEVEGISQADMAEIERQMNSETFMQAAQENFQSAVVEYVKQQVPEGRPGAAPAAPTQKQVEASSVAESGSVESNGMSFEFSNNPITLRGEKTVIVTGVFFDENGAPTGYNAYDAKFDETTGVLQGTGSAVTLNANQMRAAASELKSRQWYNPLSRTAKANKTAIIIARGE